MPQGGWNTLDQLQLAHQLRPRQLQLLDARMWQHLQGGELLFLATEPADRRNPGARLEGSQEWAMWVAADLPTYLQV
jgi:hypothetical protein